MNSSTSNSSASYKIRRAPSRTSSSSAERELRTTSSLKETTVSLFTVICVSSSFGWRLPTENVPEEDTLTSFPYTTFGYTSRAHAPVVMLAYRIARHLQQAWQDLDVTVEEGLRELSALCITQLKVRKELKGEWIPETTELGSRLSTAAGVDLPRRLPWKPEPQPNQPKPKPRRSVATKATEQEPLK